MKLKKEEAKIIAAEQPAHVAETGNYGGETIVRLHLLQR